MVSVYTSECSIQRNSFNKGKKEGRDRVYHVVQIYNIAIVWKWGVLKMLVTESSRYPRDIGTTVGS